MLNVEVLRLKENYLFDIERSILYCDQKNEIKLTKNEMKFMQLITKAKYAYVSSEQFEHSIWEEDSEYEDCNKRLKHLIYGLRKKLPKGSILNGYKLGYKLLGDYKGG